MTKPMAKWANYEWPADEAWRRVAGFPGYEVSSTGRIRSLRRSNARLMVPEIDKDGALRVALRRDGAYVHCVLARLVCEAFNGPVQDGMYCCHRDNDPTNNYPSNLRWDTQKANMADKIVHGTRQQGSRHPNALIDEAVASRIKAMLAEGVSGLDVSAACDVSKHIVYDISRGRTWGHV